ncbi:MAG: HAD hydrolase-like protein [Patescibacteria group bacterium]|nr:HAD hydrolase-like protein [Patescibacteria group bacterium]
MRKYFWEIDTDKYKNYNIIIDIDGTLCAEGESLIGEREKRAVNLLKKNNLIYIFSNNPDKIRSRDIADQVECKYLEAPHKKPCKKIINYLPKSNQPILIIGDKFLTDIIFARRIKADYILVESLRSDNDRFLVRIFNFVDDFIVKVMK